MLKQSRFAVVLLISLALAFAFAWHSKTLSGIDLGVQASAGVAPDFIAPPLAQAGSAAQPQKGSAGQAASAGQSTFGSASPNVTVTDHKMTAGPIPAQCVTPAAKYNFTPADAQAYQWTLVAGANAGDVMRWEFVQPNGSIYFQTQSAPLASGGSFCFSPSIFIAGQAAASLPGAWQTRVFYNGAPLLTENFTIGPAGNPVTVTDHKMTGGPIPDNCVAPAAKSTFTPTDERAYQWIFLSGIRTGDVIRWEFIQPNGAIYQAQEFTVNFSGSTGCFWSSIAIAGQLAASLPGNWQVRVLFNTAQIQTENFTIAANTCPTVSSISPTSGAVGANVTINGANFTGVTSVKFANNVTAQITANSGTQITVTVPTGAVTGALTISKPSCADIQTPVFTVTSQPIIGVTPTSLSFGNVKVGQNRDMQITVRNTGDLPLTVSSITSSSPQFSVTSPASPFNVAAGASAIVNLRFAPNSAGLKTGTLSINSNDPGRARVDVALAGTGLAPLLEVTPQSLNFGNVATGESLIMKLTVRNTGNAPLAITSITSSDPQFSASLLTGAFTLPAGGSIIVNVRFAPASAGAKTGTLSINSNDPNRPRLDVPMTGTGLAPAIDVSPAGLGFGQVRLAQTKDLVVTIRNTGSATLKVSSIISSNLQFSVTQLIERPSNALRNLPLSIAPNSSVEVTVRFRPSFFASSVGALAGTLSINSNDPNRPRVDVALTGTGQGALISAPSTLSFGGLTVCLATPTTATLTLANTGNAPLAVASLSIDNPAFALTPRPALPLVIAPGASATLTLSFYTRATGTQSGRLVISSNAVNNPGLAVSLSGVGTAIPPPAISQISVSRTTLSHGRADNARPASPFNPFGLASVIGFAFAGGPLPFNSIAPGVVPPALIGGFPGLPASAIASAPDPFHITLAGGVANPIVLSAANIPSCFTLVVAEGVTAPDLTRWDRIGVRFGSGNLYAAVSIPGTSIVAGMELVTEADFDAYTANSIIYESPDFGLLVAPAGQNGGTATLQARARRIPADAQCQTLFSASQSTQVEYSRTVRIEIDANRTVVARAGGGFDVTVTAQIFGNFDPA
ncbi:MAG: choice-of-anchor D domain-containing protein, partial [Acidobacteriota bacterium]